MLAINFFVFEWTGGFKGAVPLTAWLRIIFMHADFYTQQHRNQSKEINKIRNYLYKQMLCKDNVSFDKLNIIFFCLERKNPASSVYIISLIYVIPRLQPTITSPYPPLCPPPLHSPTCSNLALHPSSHSPFFSYSQNVFTQIDDFESRLWAQTQWLYIVETVYMYQTNQRIWSQDCILSSNTSLCHKFWFSNPYIFATKCCGP